MTFDEFIVANNGKSLDFDNYYGFQCTDLVRRYIQDVLGYPQPAPGNAIDFYIRFNQSQYYDKIPNSKTNVPLKGDIMVWGTGVGLNGHIGIIMSAEIISFISLDQNWPVGSPVHPQNHNYTNTLGWLHPKFNASTIDYKSLYEQAMNKLQQIKSIVS